MKKYVALMMAALILCVGVGACAQGVEVITDALYDSYEVNGVQLAVFEATFPQITGLANAAVMNGINEAIRCTILAGGYETVCEYALEDYTRDPDYAYFGEYGLWAEAYPTLTSSGSYFSVMYIMTLGAGGAHPSNWRFAQLYDLRDGQPVSITALAGDAEAFHGRVADAVLAMIKKNGTAKECDYWDHYADIVREGSYEMAITEDGLLVFYNQYDIAPYSSGVQEFRLGFDPLRGSGLYGLIWPDGVHAGITDNLAGAWRTAADDAVYVTLLLYPEDAFRLYEYQQDTNETYMLEGSRAVAGKTIAVSDVRLGMLDTNGAYTQLGEMDTVRFTFSLDPGGASKLTLTDEQGVTITFYPFDMDGPG